jgi:hypothetical protein
MAREKAAAVTLRLRIETARLYCFVYEKFWGKTAG